MNFIFDIKHFYNPKVKWWKLRKTLKMCTARDSSYFKQIKAFYYGFTINLVLNISYYLERINFHFVLKTVNIISTIHLISYFSPNFLSFNPPYNTMLILTMSNSSLNSHIYWTPCTTHWGYTVVNCNATQNHWRCLL